MIKVHQLEKRYGSRLAVRDLSFDAPDGSITGLLGSNGAGKTTTLRMICGVLKPDAGTIHIDAAAGPADALASQRRIGALLDHAGLYSRLTVRENLIYYGRLRGMTREALEDRVESVLSILGLASIADRRTAGFSQGERMRTALGRAMLHAPQNLLLDEPTNGLDVPTVRSLRGLLRSLRDSGVSIIFSSHVLDEVRALCDKVVIISGGSVVASGSPEELCAQTKMNSLENAFIKLTNKERASC